MAEVLLYAIPVFVICIILEAAAFHLLPDDDGPQKPLGYDRRDTATSLAMGIGNVLVNIGWKLVVLAAYAGAYLLAPFHLPTDNPLTWIALFFADDFAYYWYHRTHHEIRVFWASHVVHHSSERYNLSTALRQPWTPFSALPFWLALAFLGFPPWMILLQQSISLLYQFFIHTERIGKLCKPIEFVMNTPSHHRVHHGSNAQYLDRNYGGILIIWDRLFGTFEAEGERVRYGLTKNITTFNPVRVATHEWVAVWRDLRRARTWSARLGHLFRHPGWSPGDRVGAGHRELDRHRPQRRRQAGQKVPGGESPHLINGFNRLSAGQQQQDHGIAPGVVGEFVDRTGADSIREARREDDMQRHFDATDGGVIVPAGQFQTQGGFLGDHPVQHPVPTGP